MKKSKKKPIGKPNELELLYTYVTIIHSLNSDFYSRILMKASRTPPIAVSRISLILIIQLVFQMELIVLKTFRTCYGSFTRSEIFGMIEVKTI